MSTFLETSRHAALSNTGLYPCRKNQKKSLKHPA